MNKNLKLHEGEIYKYTKNDGLTLFDPSKYKHNGYTVDHLYSSFKTNEIEKQKHKEKLQELKKRYPFLEGRNLIEVLNHILMSDDVEIVSLPHDKDKFIFDYKGSPKQGKLLKKYRNEDLRFYMVDNGEFKKDKKKVGIMHDN